MVVGAVPPTPGLFKGHLYTKYTTENEHTKNDSEDDYLFDENSINIDSKYIEYKF